MCRFFRPFCRIFLPLSGFNCRQFQNTVCIINHFLLKNNGVFNQEKHLIVFWNSYSLFLRSRTPSHVLLFSRYIRLKFDTILAVHKTALSPNRAVHKLLQFSQKVAQKLLQNSKSCSKVAPNCRYAQKE